MALFKFEYQTLDATVIPSAVTADLSIRIVPDQDLDHVVKSLVAYIRSSFGNLESKHELTVDTITSHILLTDL